MKRILIVIGLLLLSVPTWAHDTWTAGTSYAHACTSTSNTGSSIITVAAGESVFVVMGAKVAGITIASAADTVNTYTHIAGSNASGNGASLDVFYIASAAAVSGQNITVTVQGGPGTGGAPNDTWQYFVLRYPHTISSVSLDTGAIGVNTFTTSLATGPTLSPIGSNDVITCGIVNMAGNVTTVATGPFTLEQGAYGPIAVADTINTTSGAQSTYNNSGSGIVSCVALTEASAATHSNVVIIN